MSEKRPYPSESETRSAIVHIGRRMWLRGFASATDGNISVRLSEGELLTTPTGVCKGFMAESALVKLDMDGNVLEREGKPSSEIRLHLALYRENPGIGAVLHAHPAAASAFAAASLPLDAPVLQEAVIRLGGEVPVAPFAVTGTAEAGEVVSPFAGTHRAALLRNHGAVSWGPDLFEAWYRMETLEHWATVLLNLRALGRSGSMSPEQTEALKAMME